MFGRRRHQPAAAKPITRWDSALVAVADWTASNPRVSASFDDAAFFDIADGVMRVLTPYGSRGHVDEMRAALVKILSAVISLPVLDGTDEDIFKLSNQIREDVYSEIMRLRRAVVDDKKQGRL